MIRSRKEDVKDAIEPEVTNPPFRPIRNRFCVRDYQISRAAQFL
ncbi:Uncharacterised protein [Mycobacteroides abscessus subsp. abscessus]|nr:Uncharacterised protein [Mycobacteroides abscessus subsp. abscessus]